ncbi:MAG: 3-deoxy-manno-octulosonate cytidylyltransferase [Fibrobacter sp.]|nr:3-deoxy-manno-octulosonate cytidylyltransferase [Fibrobacter sp.]
MASAVHCVVPARYTSSRFPGKPLVPICGRPMILRTLDRAVAAGCFKSVVCATDDIRILKTVEEAGYTAVLTGPAVTGSDRVSEAAEKLGLDLVVNLQGDEPVADLQMLRDVAKALCEEPGSWVSVAAPLAEEDRNRLSVVKVEIDSTDHATEFIRELPPEPRKWYRHVGVYAYSKEAREEFASLPQAVLEKERSLEQLRILGKRPIRMVYCTSLSASVDLPSDVQKVESILKQMEADQNGK